MGATEIWKSASFTSPQWCSVELSSHWITLHSTITIVVIPYEWWDYAGEWMTAWTVRLSFVVMTTISYLSITTSVSPNVFLCFTMRYYYPSSIKRDFLLLVTYGTKALVFPT